MRFVLILFLLFLQFCPTNEEKGILSRNSTANVSEVNSAKNVDTETVMENSERARQDDFYDIKNSLGLVSANDKRYEQNGSIRIFNEDGSLWYELSSKDENKEGVITLKKKEFMPFRINADELLVVMNCVGEDNRYYHVVVNEDAQLKKYVKKDDPILQLGTWEKYILDCFAVEFDSNNNPLHEEPNGKLSNVGDIPKNLNFHPEKIEGEWLKIRWYENNDDRQPAKFGWVKWKIDQKLVLRLFETA